MPLVKGPFLISWGANPIVEVSEVTLNYDVASNDYSTVDGRTFTVEGAITASVDVTLLASDVQSLAALLPQYYVAKGDKLSTGETVTADEGAIDIVAASCDNSNINYNLDIKACGTDAEVFRLVNARTALSAMNLDNNVLRTVTITFRGEAPQGSGSVQMFLDGGIEEES